jgi:hypothetical protein
MKEKRKIEPIFCGEENWIFNTCLGIYDDSIYYAGYLMAANKLSEELTINRSDQDLLIYPIAFLYRHHIELVLKAIKKECLIYEGKGNDKKNHNIMALWKYIKPVANNFFDNEYADQNKDELHIGYIEHVITETNKIDKSSTEFRYSTLIKNGEKTLEGTTHINFLRMAKHMNYLSEDLMTILNCINEYNKIEYENNLPE